MAKRVLTLVLAIIMSIGCKTFAQTVIREDWSTFNEDNWRFFNNSLYGEVSVDNGKLVISGTEGNWRQTGVALMKPLDLKGKRTTVTMTFLKAQFLQQMPAIVGDGSIDHDDPWNHPCFMVKMTMIKRGWLQGSVEGSEPFANRDHFQYVGGAIKPVKNGMNKTVKEFPLTIKWVLDNTNGQKDLYSKVYLNDEQRWEGSIVPGSFDIRKCYLYLYVSNDQGEGPTEIGPVTVEQD